MITRDALVPGAMSLTETGAWDVMLPGGMFITETIPVEPTGGPAGPPPKKLNQAVNRAATY